MMSLQYVLLVGWLWNLSELAHSQSSCKPAITGLLIRNTEQNTQLNETNLSVMWRADNDSGCEYHAELGTCRGNMPEFYCGETVSSTNAAFPSANCSVQCQELIVAVTASRDCVDCVSYFYLSSLNDTLVWPVEVGKSIVVSLPKAEECLSGTLPILCIRGQYNRCYGDLSSLPEHHEYDCQNGQLVLRINVIPESLNGTIYTVVNEDFIPCIDIAVSTVTGFNFQLVVYFESTSKSILGPTSTAETTVGSTLASAEITQLAPEPSLVVSSRTQTRPTLEPTPSPTESPGDDDDQIGTPNAPTNLEAELVNDNKDLRITWKADQTDPLQPIDRFFVEVNVSIILTPQETKQDSDFEYDTNDTQYTISDIDPDKQYMIVVCSSNNIGENCTAPLTYTVTMSPPPTSNDSMELEPGITTLIVILAFLFTLLCCILLLIFLYCLIKEPLRSYYPEKREKKEHEEELKEQVT